MRRCAVFVIFTLAFLLVASPAGQTADDTPKAAEPGTLIVIDANSKEQKLKTWKFLAGTRRLSWLAPKEEGDKAKDKSVGPEALEFRDDHSTNLPRGILTLIPLDRIRGIDFDNEKQTATVRIAMSDKPEEDLKLQGTTKYAGENKLAIEAEVDKGDMGIAAIKFLGGTKKAGGIKGARFPTPKAPEALPKTRAATLTATDKEKTVHKVTDLQALYEGADGRLHLAPYLTFKKTLKVDLAKVKRMKVRGGTAKEGAECDVSFKDGEEQTLTVLRDPMIDGKKVLLEGLIGRTRAGYLLFPLGTVAELQLDEAKE